MESRVTMGSEAFSDRPWGVGSLGSQQRAGKSSGGPLGTGAPPPGVWVGEVPLSGCTGDHGSEATDWSSGSHRGLGNGRNGVTARNTRNEECKAPRRPSARDEDSAAEQRQARMDRSRGPRSADSSGRGRPAQMAPVWLSISIYPRNLIRALLRALEWGIPYLVVDHTTRIS